MNLKEYKEKAMKMDDYSIILEYDKLMNEIWDLKDKLRKDKKVYSGFFKRGNARFKSIEKLALESIKEKNQKANFLAQAIYLVRN